MLTARESSQLARLIDKASDKQKQALLSRLGVGKSNPHADRELQPFYESLVSVLRDRGYGDAYPSHVTGLFPKRLRERMRRVRDDMLEPWIADLFERHRGSMPLPAYRLARYRRFAHVMLDFVEHRNERAHYEGKRKLWIPPDIDGVLSHAHRFPALVNVTIPGVVEFVPLASDAIERARERRANDVARDVASGVFLK